MNKIISISCLLFLIMDPMGNLPIFISILKNLNSKRRYIIIIREMLIALCIMFIFLFFGEQILSFLNLKTEIVSISGGIILFLTAIKLIFSSNNEDIFKLCDNEPFLVPLAIPLIAGPSILATLISLLTQITEITQLIFSLLISWSLSLIILLLSNVLLNILGNKIINAIEKLMGLLLLMISIKMILDGICFYFSFI